MDVITLPTSTTNMTGFFIIVRGFSFLIASIEARRTIFASQSDFLRVDMSIDPILFYLEGLACVQQQVLKDWAERKRGEEGQGADDEDDSDEQHGEERRVHREGSGRRRDEFLL